MCFFLSFRGLCEALHLSVAAVINNQSADDMRGERQKDESPVPPPPMITEDYIGYCPACADYGNMDSLCRYCTIPGQEMGYEEWDDPRKGYFSTFAHCTVCNDFAAATLVGVYQGDRGDKCLRCKYCNVCGYPAEHGFRLCSEHLNVKKRQASHAVERYQLRVENSELASAYALNIAPRRNGRLVTR
jgi:hypothetical protein